MIFYTTIFCLRRKVFKIFAMMQLTDNFPTFSCFYQDLFINLTPTHCPSPQQCRLSASRAHFHIFLFTGMYFIYLLTFLQRIVQVLSNGGFLLLILRVIKVMSASSGFHPLTSLSSPLRFRFLTISRLRCPVLQPVYQSTEPKVLMTQFCSGIWT